MFGNKIIAASLIVWVCLVAGMATSLHAQVPACLNYQGRIVKNGVNFTGTGQFKVKLINADATASFWSNDGTPDGGGTEPSSAVSVTVTKGLFYVRLGDTNTANMTALSAAVFTNSDIRLRIWVNTGAGFELITPDQVVASVGYAMMSANVMDGVVTPEKLAPGTTALFVPTAGGTMTGSLTNRFGFNGIGGAFSNTVVNAASNQFSVGSDQLVAVSNRVGIGTATPSSRLEVVGRGSAGEVVMKIYSGTNVIAWARKK